MCVLTLAMQESLDVNPDDFSNLLAYYTCERDNSRPESPLLPSVSESSGISSMGESSSSNADDDSNSENSLPETTSEICQEKVNIM